MPIVKCIDTNVILSFFIKSRCTENLVKLFVRIEDGEEEVYLLQSVFFQVVFVLRKFYKLKIEQVVMMMRTIINLKGIISEERKILSNTLDLWAKHDSDIVDCHIIASMQYSNITDLFSYDKGFDKFDINRIEI